jgi:hypothetical protein
MSVLSEVEQWDNKMCLSVKLVSLGFVESHMMAAALYNNVKQQMHQALFMVGPHLQVGQV